MTVAASIVINQCLALHHCSWRGTPGQTRGNVPAYLAQQRTNHMCKPVGSYGKHVKNCKVGKFYYDHWHCSCSGVHECHYSWRGSSVTKSCLQLEKDSNPHGFQYTITDIHKDDGGKRKKRRIPIKESHKLLYFDQYHLQLKQAPIDGLAGGWRLARWARRRTTLQH